MAENAVETQEGSEAVMWIDLGVFVFEFCGFYFGSDGYELGYNV